MHVNWSSYWPSLEYWLSAPSIVALIAALGAVALGFIRVTTDRVVSLGILAVVVWYAVSFASSRREKPEHDYTFLLLDPEQAQVVDGKVTLFAKSTGEMDGVRVCFSLTGDYHSPNYSDCGPPFHSGEQNASFGTVGMGDYTIDIDADTKLGKVRERLDIVENHGKAVTVFSRVQRRETGEVLCEMPPHAGVKPCI